MDDYLRAILLGIVQAVTEFLPVSSSGHLILAPQLFGEEASSLTFDVALHVGTLVAVLGYFWRDWLRIGHALVLDLRQGAALQDWSMDARLGLLLAVGSIPGGLVGFFLGTWIEDNVRDPLIVAAMLIIFGLILGATDRWGAQTAGLHDIHPKRSLLIGCAQAVALIPGVSRSGATISMGRLIGLDRVSAARFSFLLSAPIVTGAGAYKLVQAAAQGEVATWGPLIAGAVAAAVVGAFVIRALLAFLGRATLAVFVWYRIALGLVVITASSAGWI